jgi:penicillin amidase/acyl-homoserine-lactone acylase
VVALRASANRLLARFARLDPTWGQVNRLRRANVDLPLSGGPDALRDIETPLRPQSDGTLTAQAGDSLTLISSWTRDGRWQVESVDPFGSSNVSGSPHYADQAQLFTDERLKIVPLTPAALMAEATSVERPGKPPIKGNIIVPGLPAPEAGAKINLGGAANAAERKPPVKAVHESRPGGTAP